MARRRATRGGVPRGVALGRDRGGFVPRRVGWRGDARPPAWKGTSWGPSPRSAPQQRAKRRIGSAPRPAARARERVAARQRERVRSTPREPDRGKDSRTCAREGCAGRVASAAGRAAQVDAAATVRGVAERHPEGGGGGGRLEGRRGSLRVACEDPEAKKAQIQNEVDALVKRHAPRRDDARRQTEARDCEDCGCGATGGGGARRADARGRGAARPAETVEEPKPVETGAAEEAPTVTNAEIEAIRERLEEASEAAEKARAEEAETHQKLLDFQAAHAAAVEDRRERTRRRRVGVKLGMQGGRRARGRKGERRGGRGGARLAMERTSPPRGRTSPPPRRRRRRRRASRPSPRRR